MNDLVQGIRPSFINTYLRQGDQSIAGYGPNGIEDLKKQSFFATINWEKLVMRQVSPPFKPTSNRAGDDTFYFDKQFTAKTPRGKKHERRGSRVSGR